MYKIVTTKQFDKRLGKLPMSWQKRIVDKIREVAADPYARNHNLTKLQGREGYRLRIGDWRIVYKLENDRMIMLVVELDTRGGIYAH